MPLALRSVPSSGGRSTPTRRPVLRRLAVAAFVLCAGTAAQAEELLVAVAANFAGPMAKIAERFQAASGHVAKISSGATGKLYTQVAEGGAPFHVFVSADDKTPRRLVEEGHAVAGTNFTYAIGQLVLWSADPAMVDAEGAVLAADKVKHVAIANPKVAPYGAAAMEVLKARGLTEAITPKLVTGESIAQTYQFVVSGNAEVGFVALSQVAVPDKPMTGSVWKVPKALYSPILQDAVLLKAGADSPGARALVAYLKSEPARRIIESYGYGIAAQ